MRTWTKPHCVAAAVVLGTALTTWAPAEVPERAVSDISRYCTACWRNARLPPDCWNDCTQEVFCRLLERVTPATWDRILNGEGEERREFLRAIDTIKKRSQRRRPWTGRPIESVADRREQHARRLAVERDVVWSAADLLSTRQQRILRLCCEGWTVHEIADHLALPPERISDEKYKAIRKLRERLADSA